MIGLGDDHVIGAKADITLSDAGLGIDVNNLSSAFDINIAYRTKLCQVRSFITLKLFKGGPYGRVFRTQSPQSHPRRTGIVNDLELVPGGDRIQKPHSVLLTVLFVEEIRIEADWIETDPRFGIVGIEPGFVDRQIVGRSFAFSPVIGIVRQGDD